MTQERRQVPRISGTEVKILLKQGYTRFAADDEGFGSIEQRYGLTPAGVRRLFQNDKLKGLKTVIPEFEFVDDIAEEEIELEEVDVTDSIVITRTADDIAPVVQPVPNVEEAVVRATKDIFE